MEKTLRYQNETLNIKSIKIDESHTNFIQITTTKYFSRLNYKNGDLFCFKNVTSNNVLHQALCDYINDTKGHKIYLRTDTDKVTNDLENLFNVFYISKKGDYNSSDGKFEVDSTIKYDSLATSTVSGNIINKNLQLLLKMKITSKEKNFSFFNPQII